MRESDLLAHIASRSVDLPQAHPHVLVGPGDDCAVVRCPSGSVELLTVDHLVEGRHFTPGAPLDLIARKALARSVSDIAAMAGVPRWGLATGLLPAGWPHADQLFEAMARWARHWNCPLVGGDIASWGASTGPLVLTVTVGGAPHPVRGPVLRSGAKAGDEVWVTGKLGGSFPSGRHMTFEPRVEFASRLADVMGSDLHAMIDISDGLGRDAARIGAASGVRLELEALSIPAHDAPADPLRDGEDHELLFAASPGSVTDSLRSSIPLTRIGRCLAGTGCVLIRPSEVPLDLTAAGWDH